MENPKWISGVPKSEGWWWFQAKAQDGYIYLPRKILVKKNQDGKLATTLLDSEIELSSLKDELKTTCRYYGPIVETPCPDPQEGWGGQSPSENDR